MAEEAAQTDEIVCTCGQPGTVWGYCECCGLDRWVFHHCPGGCDDVTCENLALCLACSTGNLCPAHDADDYAMGPL